MLKLSFIRETSASSVSKALIDNGSGQIHVCTTIRELELGQNKRPVCFFVECMLLRI